MKRFGTGVSKGLVVAIVLTGATCVGGCTDKGGTSVSPYDVVGTSLTVATDAPGDPQFDAAFNDLAEALAPVPIFALADIPMGMAVAPNWWPVIDGGSSAESRNQGANPRIVGGGQEEPEGQLILACKDGWLAVVANFGGDLGDVRGERVGSIAGEPAHLYEVNGGWLVQWSYDGRWYGLFGRGVSKELVASTALSMTLVEQY
jgi:hypothetical protein